VTHFEPERCPNCGMQIFGPKCNSCENPEAHRSAFDRQFHSGNETWNGFRILVALAILATIAAFAAYAIWPDLQFWKSWQSYFGFLPRYPF
jgi:hypothetical protein